MSGLSDDYAFHFTLVYISFYENSVEMTIDQLSFHLTTFYTMNLHYGLMRICFEKKNVHGD